MPTSASLRSFWINWPCGRRRLGRMTLRWSIGSSTSGPALNASAGPERTGTRHLPWLIDILLYPANLSGIITLGTIVFAALWEYVILVSGYTTGRMYVPGGIIGLYLGWYLAECVYDSATGGTRAPEIFDVGDLDGLWSRVAYLLAVYVFFALPPVLYLVLAGRADVIFWGLVACAIFFLPMALLAMVIHDSSSIFNPLFLLGAIVHVFGPYVGLLLSIVGLAGLFWYGNVMLLEGGLAPATLVLLDILAGSYTALVLAHVLGRFYWHYSDRLDWGI